MKKLFFLAAMCCLVMNTWADGTWTQVAQVTCTKYLTDFKYDAQTKTISFNDTYLNSTSMYQRYYSFHFYYRTTQTHLYTRNLGFNEYLYGYLNANNVTETIIKESGKSSPLNPTMMPSNSKGGKVSLSIAGYYDKEFDNYTDLLVAVSAAYKLEASDSWHYYSCDASNTNTYFLSNMYNFSLPTEYEVSVTGPCMVKLNSNGQWESTNNIFGSDNKYHFDTTSFTISAYDTLYFDNWSDGECLENVSGEASRKNDYIYITGFNKSQVLTANVKQHTIQFYVDGNIYKTIKVDCDLTPIRCNQQQITNPTGLQYWQERGTGNTYQTNQIWSKIFTDDAVFDAVCLKNYALYVKGEQITSANDDDILGNGTMSYDDATKTLTLNNANISYANGDAIAAYQDMVIECMGNDTIESTGSGNAINMDENAVTFTGSGSLTAKSNTSAAIYAEGGLTVKEGCTLTAQSANNSAVSVAGESITVDGANLIAKGNGTEATIVSCNSLVLKNGAAIRSNHTYDAVNHQFLNASSEEAKDDIIIGIKGTTGIEDIIENQNENVRKLLRNGQLLIIRDGKTYNAQGAKL